MKYCLFDGGDVVGPFSAEQLLHRPGFGAHSLVCPEEYSDEEAYWKEARFYAEFGFEAPAAQPAPAMPEESADSAQFLKEMDTAITEISSLNVREKTASQSKEPAADTSALSAPAEKEQTPKAPAPADGAKPAADLKTPSKKQTPAGNKNKKAKEPAPTISAMLLRESEEMKRQRIARAAAEEAEKQHLGAHKSAPAPDTPAADAEKSTSLPPAQETEKDESAFNAAVEKATHSPSSVSPIEEYFNTIKSGDLGNILGMPDPKENSDMNLSRMLKKQFEKTDPGLMSAAADNTPDPFDEFAPKGKTEELDESLFAPTPEQADKKTEENLTHSLPDLKSAQPLPLAGQEPPADDALDTQPPQVQEMIVPEQEDDPNDKTVKTILEGKLKVDTLRQEIPEPIKEVPPEPDYMPHARPGQNLPGEQYVAAKTQGKHSKMKFVSLFAGLFVLLLGAYLNWTHMEQPARQEQTLAQAQQPAQPQSQTPQEPPVPPARQAINAVADETQDPLELAKEIVQNYQLGEGRGTVEEYLNKLYAKQLHSGYAAMWSAEPLHRNAYVVKYRLAKTRKEPIVYIFQADTAKKKLTGALNNITLDLVGKIS